MSDLYVARGNQSSLMTGRETSYGTKAGSLTMTHNYETFGAKISDAPIALAGARAQNDTAYPVQGGRTISGSVSTESTADVVGWWLALGMGSQSTPSTAIVNTTASGAVALNATSGTVASGLNIFPGMKLTWGTSPVTVASVSGTTVNFTAGIAAAQTAGCAVTCTATGAYLSKFTLANDLGSFTSEVNLLNAAGGSFACDDFLGCMVESLAFALAKGQVKVTPSIDAQNFLAQGAPAVPTYSTKNPFVFEQQFAPPQWNAIVIGTGAEASVLSASATLNNNLDKGKYSLGNGNLQRKPQVQTRSVSGSLSLDFATTTVRDAFRNASGGEKAPVTLTLPVAGTDIADPTNGVPYAMTIVLPKIYLSAWDGGWKGSGALTQSVSFTGHPSGQGTNDSITVYYIGTNPAAF